MLCAQVMGITHVVQGQAARHDDRAMRPPRAHAPGGGYDAGHAPRGGAYVLVPDPLIIAFAHDPLAVGVYCAVARLVAAAKAATPVAARDLVAWMGARGARPGGGNAADCRA